MKGAFLAAVLATCPSAASGQMFSPERMIEHTQTPPAVQAITTIGTVTPAPLPKPEVEEIVVIKYGRGGGINEHISRFAGYRNRGVKVEIRGPCYSACTMVMTYVAPANMCVAPGAFLAFHQVRSMETGKGIPVETAFMYQQFPQGIRDWIDRAGGHKNLPLSGFWTMPDRDLWAIGYPQCQERP